MKKRALWMAGLGLLAVAAFAANPHFSKVSDSISNSGDLNISFTESGLGSGESVTVSATASANFTYACINGGKHNPQASQFVTIDSGGGTSDTLTAGHNGRVRGELTISPSASDTLSCPHGQRSVLAVISYSNITLSDNLGNTATAPDISQTFYDVQ